MPDIDVKQMIAGLQERQAAGGEGDLNGMSVDDLVDAVSHPKAAAQIAAMFELDQQSVQEGEPAPEIALPWLANTPADAPDRFVLSAQRGQRPVALVFGSYT